MNIKAHRKQCPTQGVQVTLISSIMSMRGSKVFELFLHFKHRTIEQKKKEQNMITCRATCTDTKDFLSKKKLKQKMFDHKLTLTHQFWTAKQKKTLKCPWSLKNYGSLFEMLFKIKKNDIFLFRLSFFHFRDTQLTFLYYTNEKKMRSYLMFH